MPDGKFQFLAVEHFHRAVFRVVRLQVAGEGAFDEDGGVFRGTDVEFGLEDPGFVLVGFGFGLGVDEEESDRPHVFPVAHQAGDVHIRLDGIGCPGTEFARAEGEGACAFDGEALKGGVGVGGGIFRRGLVRGFGGGRLRGRGGDVARDHDAGVASPAGGDFEALGFARDGEGETEGGG